MDTNPAAKIDILTQSVKELNINQLYADHSNPSHHQMVREIMIQIIQYQVFMLNSVNPTLIVVYQQQQNQQKKIK